MSSVATVTTSSGPGSIQASHLLTPVTQPIPLISKPIVRTFSNAYTVGVLLYYYLRAGALVADPLTTLLQDIVPVATFQALFCLSCVPGAGFWYSGTDVGKGAKIVSASTRSKHDRKSLGTPQKPRGGGARSEDSGVTGGAYQQRVLPTIFSLVLAVSVPPVPLAILALVLGAPLYPTSLIPHTFAIAMHVSLLAIMPIFYTHGVSGEAWSDFAAAWLPFDEAGVWAGTVGCLVGGWVGAIPMALDWDREWQKWPCTVLWGAVLGWGVGRFMTGVLRLGIGKRINLSENLRVGRLTGGQTTLETAEKKTK